MEPISTDLLIAANDGDVIDFGDVQFKVIYTPGHAIHHNAYQLNDIIFTGDVAGCKIENGPVVPPCPPPDIDITLWKKSIQKLKDENYTVFDVGLDPKYTSKGDYYQSPQSTDFNKGDFYEMESKELFGDTPK